MVQREEEKHQKLMWVTVEMQNLTKNVSLWLTQKTSKIKQQEQQYLKDNGT